jgi:hypothetical protein
MTAEHRKTRTGRRAQVGERLRLLTAGVLVLATVLGAQRALARKVDAARAARLALIRGLGHEIAVAKVALPRGKKGVFLDDEGRLDQAKAEAELRRNGQAVRPGMPVQITKIVFKSNRIIFEINGGGRGGKKWYQRIEVGMGTTTHPVVPDAPVLTHGSSISLSFSGKISAMTVEQVEQRLGSVLDFERRSPTVLYSPTVPPEIKEASGPQGPRTAGGGGGGRVDLRPPPARPLRDLRWRYGCLRAPALRTCSATFVLQGCGLFPVFGATRPRGWRSRKARVQALRCVVRATEGAISCPSDPLAPTLLREPG